MHVWVSIYTLPVVLHLPHQGHAELHPAQFPSSCGHHLWVVVHTPQPQDQILWQMCPISLDAGIEKFIINHSRLKQTYVGYMYLYKNLIKLLLSSSYWHTNKFKTLQFVKSEHNQEILMKYICATMKKNLSPKSFLPTQQPIWLNSGQ